MGRIMASGGFKCNQPELVAIYRLEFYKNKKKWKFSNERKESPALQAHCPQPTSGGPAPKTKHRDKLNETYEVTASSDSEKESSPLNNAFMHEIPTDDTPEDEVFAPPVTSQPPEEEWEQPRGLPGAVPSHPPPISGDDATGAHAQTLGPFTNQPQAQPTPNNVHIGLDYFVAPTQHSGRTTSCTDHHQPDVNLEWHLRTSGRTPANLEQANNQPTTQEPWQPNFWTNEQTPGSENPHSQGLWTKPPPMMSTSQQRPQNIPNIVSPTGPRLFNPNPWSIPPPISHVPLQNKVMSVDLLKKHGVNYVKEEENLPQPPPANCLQMLLCPDTWKKTPSNQKYQDQFATTGADVDAPPLTEPLLLRNQRVMPHQNAIRPDTLGNLEQPPSAIPPSDRRLVSETWITNQNVPPPHNWIEQQSIITPGNLNNRQNVPLPDTWPSKPPPDTWTPQPHKQSIPAPDTNTSNQSVPPPCNWTNNYSVNSTGTLTKRHSASPPDTWTQKQSIPTVETWINQTRNVSQFPCQESYTNQRSSARLPQLVTPEDLLQRVHQEPRIKAPPPTPERCPTEPWCDFRKVEDVWTDPAEYANLEEVQQNFWNHQAWQKEDDYVNQEWAPSAGEDVPDGAGEEAFPPYSEASPRVGALSAARVRRGAAAWLARLLALERPPHQPRPGDGGGDADESADFLVGSDVARGGGGGDGGESADFLVGSDVARGGGEGDADESADFLVGSDVARGGGGGDADESADFLRAAHDAPHSSEKDPDESAEWACACAPPAPLASLPAPRLAAALRHAARALRRVLGEQLRRDRLRARTLQNMVEYPTRDTDLFPHELVLGGSHLTRALDALGDHEEPERLIRIAMGRPYRL